MMQVNLSDPEKVPVMGYDSDDSLSDDDDENYNESLFHTNTSAGEESDLLNSDLENVEDIENIEDLDIEDEELDDQGANYLVRSSSGSEILLPLDDMSEDELEGLLHELEKSVRETGHPLNYFESHQHTCVDTSPPVVYETEPLLYPPQSHGHKHQEEGSNPPKKVIVPHPSLPLLEVVIYYSMFLMGIGYSLYKFYSFGQKQSVYLPLSASPTSIFGRQRDDSDIEWYVWPNLLLPYAHYAFLHAFAASVVRKYAHKHLCALYISWSICVIYSIVGSVGLILCLSVPALVLTVLLTRNKKMLWIAWCLILLTFNMEPVTSKLEQLMAPIAEGDYKVSVMVAWIILRSLSYSLETCDADPDNSLPISRQILTLFAYCLYLPFIFTGPFMPYVDFMTGLNAPYQPWTPKRVLDLVIQLMRFTIWVVAANCLLHQFYAHALHWSPQLVVRMDSWAMGGFLFYLFVFFMIKYVVLYGFPGVIASIEGYKAPPPPKCVIFMWRFSQLWRDFDRGLYMFMTRHIYLPWVAGSSRSFMNKFQGTALVFTFVYVWHGVNPQVMIWSGINFCGVMLESAADTIAARPSYQKFEQRYFSDAMKRRYHGICCAFLLLPSVIALAIFLTSLDNAASIGTRVFISGSPVVLVTLMGMLYLSAQISFEIQNWKIGRGDKSVKLK